MLRIITQFFAAPTYKDDPDQSRVASNLFLMLRITLIATLILSIVNMSLIALLAIFFELGLVYVANTGRIHATAFLFTFFSWIMLMNSAVDTGGLQAIGYTSGGLLSVLLAGFLLKRLHIFTFFSLTVVFGVVLVYLQANMMLPPVRVTDTPERRLMAYSVFLFVGSGLAYITVNSIQNSLEQTQKLLLKAVETETALREREEQFRLISSATSDYTFSVVWNEKDQFLEHTMLSGAVEKILGYTPEEFLQIGGWEAILHPDEAQNYQSVLAKLERNEQVTTEARIIKKGGEVRWVQVSMYPTWDKEKDELLGANGGVQDITARKQAEIELVERERTTRRFQEQLEVLHSLNIDLGAAQSLDEFCRLAVELSRESLGFDRVGVWMYDEERQLSVGTYGTGPDGETIDESHLQFSLDAFPIDRLILSGKKQYILHDPYEITDTDGKVLGDGWFAQAALWNGESVIGYICVDNLLSGQRVQPHLMELLTILGTTIGNLYTRKHSELMLRENEVRLQTLNKVAHDISSLGDLNSTLKLVLEKLKAILPLDAFYVALHRLETQTVTFPIMYDDGQFWDQPDGTLTQSGWVAEVLRTGQPKLVNRTPEEIEMRSRAHTRVGNIGRVSASIMMAPLPVGHENIGVISVQSYSLNAYSEKHLDILVGAGYQIAIAVQNAQLYDSLQDELVERRRLESELQDYAERLEVLVDQRTNALNRAKEQLELVLNNTSNALAFADPSGDVIVTNPAFQAAFAVGDSKSIELILWSLASEEQIAIVSEALLKTINESAIQRVEAQVVTREGQTKDIDVTFIPIKLEDDGTRNGILLSGHDITDMKEIERFKARFVADAVHDMATPITGLSTRLYLLKRSPENLNQHVSALENQVKHLRNLLEDLRTLSKMDRGQLELSMEQHNINELVQQVYDIYEPVAMDKQQTLKMQLDRSVPLMDLDQRQIERALVNLVSNAINYTASNKEIRIETALENDQFVFRVIDQGIGIGKDDLPFVFDRFYRTNQARENISSGTGLGLAISKEIVEMHRGSVSVESEVGVGSTFTVRLPLQS